VSRFLPIEPRWACCHRFIFQQRFTLSHPLSTQTEALNPHHRRWPPSPDRPTPTLHCYKNVISTLVTLPATQPCLHFASSVVKVPCQRSSTCHYHSLLSQLHVCRPSAQRHPQWWTIRPSFASQTTYRYVNSCKKYILKSRSITRGYQLVYLYFYDPLQVINFNSLNMQVCHIISCHVIFFSLKNIYIFMTHYKSLISILSTCKYVTSSYVMSSFFIEKYVWKFKKYATSSFSIENNSKNSRKSPHVP
jgi:hypothetical protein